MVCHYLHYLNDSEERKEFWLFNELFAQYSSLVCLCLMEAGEPRMEAEAQMFDLGLQNATGKNMKTI